MQNQQKLLIRPVEDLQLISEPARELVLAAAEKTEFINIGNLTTSEFAMQALKASRIGVDKSFWETLTPDDSLEFWSSDMAFLFSCGNFLKLTSFSVPELLSKNWADLFRRDQIHNLQIGNAVQKALSTGKPQYQVTPSHLVTENSAAAVSVLVEVKSVFPIHLMGDSSVNVGVVGVVRYSSVN